MAQAVLAHLHPVRTRLRQGTGLPELQNPKTQIVDSL
jgi:hypothetical protein